MRGGWASAKGGGGVGHGADTATTTNAAQVVRPRTCSLFATRRGFFGARVVYLWSIE